MYGGQQDGRRAYFYCGLWEGTRLGIREAGISSVDLEPKLNVIG